MASFASEFRDENLPSIFFNVRAKYSIAGTGSDSTQELNIVAVAGSNCLAWICAGEWEAVTI
jgi:hypothetical protein